MDQGLDTNGEESRNDSIDLGAVVTKGAAGLHPTRAKVLAALAELCSQGQWVTSTQIRQHTGLSQQLLNRHLRALESSGYAKLAHPGPGHPLNATITPKGLSLHSVPEDAGSIEPPSGTDPVEAPHITETTEETKGPEQRPETAHLAEEVMKRIYEAVAPLLGEEEKKQLGRMFTGREELETLPDPKGPVHWAEKGAGREAVLPELSTAEEALERRLSRAVHPEYKGMAWYARTRALSNEWDYIRRRRQGSLNTYFMSFEPRWLRPDWQDFNQARRQADARGAGYQDWVEAQYERFTDAPEGPVPPPHALHGKEAAKAYDKKTGASGKETRPKLGPSPFRQGDFDLANPEHVAYVEGIFDEIEELARNIFTDEDKGRLQLLSGAVSGGKIPLDALDLRPRWKEQVLDHMESSKEPDKTAQPEAPTRILF